MTNQQKRLLIITLVIVAVAVLGVAIWWYFNRQPAVNNTANVAPVNTNTSVVVVNTTNTAPTNQLAKPSDDEKLTAIRLANLFTERFGSYSNQSGMQNITDLKPYMTAAMQSWADQYVATQKKAVANTNTYQATVTKVLSTVVTKQTSTAIDLRISTSRSDESGGEQVKSYYQDLVIKMVKVGSDWKVDGAYWQ